MILLHLVALALERMAPSCLLCLLAWLFSPLAWCLLWWLLR